MSCQKFEVTIRPNVQKFDVALSPQVNKFNVNLAPNVRNFDVTLAPRTKTLVNLSNKVRKFNVVIATGRQGPQGPPGSELPPVTGQNQDSVTIRPGHAVALHSSGVGFILADKSSFAKRAVGISLSTAAPGFQVSAQLDDVIELSSWEDALGTSSFPALSRLYLGSQGSLSVTPTETSGDILQVLGEAIGPQKLRLRIDEPIRRS